MPLYEYQGQQYDIATEDQAEAKAKILKHLGKEPTTTSFTQDVGIGLTDLMHSGKNAWDLGAGALASAFNQEEGDKIFANMEARKAARKAEMSGVEQGFGGKVAICRSWSCNGYSCRYECS